MVAGSKEDHVILLHVHPSKASGVEQKNCGTCVVPKPKGPANSLE